MLLETRVSSPTHRFNIPNLSPEQHTQPPVLGPGHPRRNVYYISAFLLRLSSACVWHTRIYVYMVMIWVYFHRDEKFDRVLWDEGLPCVGVNIYITLPRTRTILCSPWDKTCSRLNPIAKQSCKRRRLPYKPPLFCQPAKLCVTSEKQKQWKIHLNCIVEGDGSRCYNCVNIMINWHKNKGTCSKPRWWYKASSSFPLYCSDYTKGWLYYT